MKAFWTVEDHEFVLSVPDIEYGGVGIDEIEYWHPPEGRPLEYVIDLGANIGTFSLYAAWRGAKIVYAFEPVPLTLQHLIGSIAMNGCWGKIIPLPYAVADSAYQTNLMKGLNLGQFGIEFNDTVPLEYDPVMVRIKPFMEMLDMVPRVDFLKMDIEGSEWAIFDELINSEANTTCFLHKVQHMLIECHPLDDAKFFHGVSGDYDRIQKYLTKIGYDVRVPQPLIIIATKP